MYQRIQDTTCNIDNTIIKSALVRNNSKTANAIFGKAEEIHEMSINQVQDVSQFKMTVSEKAVISVEEGERLHREKIESLREVCCQTEIDGKGVCCQTEIDGKEVCCQTEIDGKEEFTQTEWESVKPKRTFRGVVSEMVNEMETLKEAAEDEGQVESPGKKAAVSRRATMGFIRSKQAWKL